MFGSLEARSNSFIKLNESSPNIIFRKLNESSPSTLKLGSLARKQACNRLKPTPLKPNRAEPSLPNTQLDSAWLHPYVRLIKKERSNYVFLSITPIINVFGGSTLYSGEKMPP